MSASVFESIPDKTLFRFIKIVMEHTDFETLESSQDSDLLEGVEEAELTMGVRGINYSLDCDYIYNVWQMNKDLFEKNKLTQPLNTPNLNKIEFDWYAWETQLVKLTYRHQLETYSSSKEEIINSIEKMRFEGDYSYWDGDLIDTDNYDSEANDDSIDTDSFKII